MKIQLNKAKYSLIVVSLLLSSCGGNDVSNGLIVAEEFSASVEEGLAEGTSIGAVAVTNNTGQSLTYIIESQTPEGALEIDANTGILTVAETQLFSENLGPISGVYSAIAEGGESDAALFNVTVTPVDPNKDRLSFVTTWRTTVANETITIPTLPGLTYSYTVDWGDGNTSINQTGNASHVYAVAETYEISINGVFPAIYFNFGSQSLQIQTIEQWGNIQWQTMRDAFEGCSNLTYNATDVPDLSNVTDMSRMFRSASRFNGFVGSWDVSTITSMNALFENASRFNQPIGDWDVSNVRNMNDLFENAVDFNQPIGDWDVSNVSSMVNMFESAVDFNQPIGDWDVGSVTSMFDMFEDATSFNQPIGDWNVSNVSSMGQMFDNAAAFNQPLNDWDVSNVTSMADMFERADSFNQPLNDWDVSNVRNMRDMFEFAETFNQDLSGWSVANVTSCGTFNRGGIMSPANLPNFTNCTP